MAISVSVLNGQLMRHSRQRQVNAAYVDPSYIAKVRKKLDLDQREAAAIFGGGSP